VRVALRSRMSCFAAEHPEYMFGGAGKANIEDCNMDQSSETKGPTSDPSAAWTNIAKMINQIRKYFDSKDPLSFLERVEELHQGFRFSRDQLLRLPELLRGETYCGTKTTEMLGSDDFCQEFRQQYLPRRYRIQLTREIRSCTQRPNEPFHKHATVMLTDMRRAWGFSREAQLKRLYENMHPEYKLYIRLDDVTSLGDLNALASEYESIEKQRRALRVDRKTATESTIAYCREECCWRCKQRGHIRADCRRPPRKFCFRCGKDGVLIRECHPSSGNATRTGEDAVVTRYPPN